MNIAQICDSPGLCSNCTVPSGGLCIVMVGISASGGLIWLFCPHPVRKRRKEAPIRAVAHLSFCRRLDMDVTGKPLEDESKKYAGGNKR